MKTTANAHLDALAEALSAHPGATVAEVSGDIGLARSTTAKLLAQMEATGRASREPGTREGARRQPDRWTLAEEPAKGPAKSRHLADGKGIAGRLGRGQLRDLVVEALGSGEAGPTALAKRLGRSAGAVGNALERLQDLGLVTRTGEHPRRYRLCVGGDGARPTQ